MFLYSGNLPLLYSGNPKIKRRTTYKRKKKKSYKSFDLQDFAEREGDDIRSPSSVTR